MKRLPSSVAISQSMYFPWVGFLEQLMLCTTFVRLDNVQFAKGFINRVQVKTASGTTWLTVPLRGSPRGTKIVDVEIDNSQNWRTNHLETLRRQYVGTTYGQDALAIAEGVLEQQHTKLGDLAFDSVMRLCRYYEIDADLTLLDSRNFPTESTGSERIMDLVTSVDAKTYITGRGALRYMKHEDLEARGIQVRYMQYRHLPWPQRYGDFTPFVTSLDLVAHTGRAGLDYLHSTTEHWRNVSNE